MAALHVQKTVVVVVVVCFEMEVRLSDDLGRSEKELKW